MIFIINNELKISLNYLLNVGVFAHQDKIVEKKKLDVILKAAFAAPSTGNNQPCEMIVVTKKSIIDDIREGFSTAMQNILLCTTALGLGSLWVGVYGKLAIKTISDIVKLPEHVIPCGIAYIGYAKIYLCNS